MDDAPPRAVPAEEPPRELDAGRLADPVTEPPRDDVAAARGELLRELPEVERDDAPPERLLLEAERGEPVARVERVVDEEPPAAEPERVDEDAARDPAARPVDEERALLLPARAPVVRDDDDPLRDEPLADRVDVERPDADPLRDDDDVERDDEPRLDELPPRDDERPELLVAIVLGFSVIIFTTRKKYVPFA